MKNTLISLLVVLGLTACGRGAQMIDKEVLQSLTLAPADNIQFQVLEPNSSNPVVPSSKQISKGTAVASGKQYVFRDVIRVSPKGLFLSWNEKLAGKRITNAYYTPELQDDQNRATGGGERKNATFQSEGGYWFFPLLDLLGGDAQQANPAEMHWILLELHVEDAAVITLRVGLRMVGDLPAIRVEKLSQGNRAAQLAPEYFLTELSRTGKGWVVSEDRFKNPSLRKLSLEFSPSSAHYSVRSIFVFDRLNSAMGQSLVSRHVSQTFALEPTSWEIVRFKYSAAKQAWQEEVQSQPWSNEALQVELGPNEQIRVRTIAKIAGGLLTCPFRLSGGMVSYQHWGADIGGTVSRVVRVRDGAESRIILQEESTPIETQVSGKPLGDHPIDETGPYCNGIAI
ncbi:hypothetical protein K2X30_06295 [bacterium]|nr:hypothetical protein [bacterium]